MVKAETVMKTDVLTVRKDTSIYEAIRTMVDKNITGLPVVDDDMRLVGIITEKDVLDLLYNFKDGPGTVEEYMTTEVVSFDRQDDLVDIAESFMQNHFRRVPVVSDGKVAGIISKRDVIAYIHKIRFKDTAVTA